MQTCVVFARMRSAGVISVAQPVRACTSSVLFALFVRSLPFGILRAPGLRKMQSPSNEGLSMSVVVCARALMRRWPTFPLGPANGGLGPGALGPGKGRARFSIPMPSVSYGQPALYKKMRAGDSPMWKSNTRYNQTHESRIPHIVQPSLFGDTAFFTASGDLFLQTMRHEFPHAIQNEEATRTPRMKEMFKNILAASKTADDLYAPGLGDAGFDYLTKFPEVFASLLSFPSAGVVSCPPARCPPPPWMCAHDKSLSLTSLPLSLLSLLRALDTPIDTSRCSVLTQPDVRLRRRSGRTLCQPTPCRAAS